MKLSSHTRLIPILLLALAAGGVIPGMADNRLYRWQDSNGNLIHSDRPPTDGAQYEVVSAPTALRLSPDTEEQTDSAGEADGVDPNKAAASEKNKERCQTARTNLDTLKNSAEVRIRNAQGEERLLTPEEIIVERQTASAQVSVYCE